MSVPVCWVFCQATLLEQSGGGQASTSGKRQEDQGFSTLAAEWKCLGSLKILMPRPPPSDSFG